MLTRRQFLGGSVGGGAVLMFGGRLLGDTAFGAPSVATRLDPYLDPMPLLVDNAIDATSAAGATYDYAPSPPPVRLLPGKIA